MKEEKKEKKSGVKTIIKGALITLGIAAAGYLSYKYIPGVKGCVGKFLPKKNSLKFNTPTRKYETYKK